MLKPSAQFCLLAVLLFLIACKEKPAANNNAISHIEVSSTLQDKKDRYNKSHLTDRTYKPWCEGKPDDGIGESMTIYFKEPVKFGMFFIINGYPGGEYFYRNNRIKTLAIISDSKLIKNAELKDTDWGETVSLGDEKEIMTTAITLKIVSVYPGEKDRDTCVGEIGFESPLIKSPENSSAATGNARDATSKPQCYKFGDECVDTAKWSDFLGTWEGGSVTTHKQNETVNLTVDPDQTCSWSSSEGGNHSCTWEPGQEKASPDGVNIMLNFSGSGPGGARQIMCDKDENHGGIGCAIYLFKRR